MTTCVETSRDREGGAFQWYSMVAVFAVLSVGLIMAVVAMGHDMQQALRSTGRGVTLGTRFWVMTGLGMVGWVGSGLWLLGTHLGTVGKETRFSGRGRGRWYGSPPGTPPLGPRGHDARKHYAKPKHGCLARRGLVCQRGCGTHRADLLVRDASGTIVLCGGWRL